ncbi:MAG: glycosyltransferase [Candidatus Dormibacteria bacterium]
MSRGTAPPPASIIIATRNRPDHLEACLARLLVEAPDQAEIIVADQSDGDASERIVRGSAPDPRVRYVRCPPEGAGAARNAGCSAARSDLLLLVDDDCRVEPGWFGAWVSFMASCPRVGIAFGTVLAGPATAAGWLPAFEAPAVAVLAGRGLFLRLGEAVGMGANMAVRRTAWLAADGFDELLGPGAPFRAADDIDLAYRAARKRWQIAQTSGPQVTHVGFRADRDAGRLAETYLYGAGAAYMKHIRCGDAFAALVLGRSLSVQAVGVARNLATGRRPLGARSLPWYLIGAWRSLGQPVDGRSRRYLPRTPRRASAGAPACTSSPGGARPEGSGRTASGVRVSVCVATRNRGAAISPTLASLRRLDHDSFEVIVVDQSTDLLTEAAFRAVAEGDPRFHYVPSPTVGKSVACNIALAHAGGEVVAFTDDDCIAPHDWLTGMERTLARDPALAMVCGGITTPPGDRRQHLTTRFLPTRDRHHRSPWAVGQTFGIGGGNVAFRTQALRAAGGFDEVLGVGGPLRAAEDRDILYRLLRGGEEVMVVREPAVEHHELKETATEGRLLLGGYAFGEGAMCMKHLRLGDPAAALPMLVSGPYLRLRWGNILRLRRPTGAYILAEFVRGGMVSLRYPVDRDSRTFAPRPTGAVRRP